MATNFITSSCETKSSVPVGIEDKQDTMQAWKLDVLKWYPQLHERAYFLPPVYMKRINYDLQHIADQPVAVPTAGVKAAAKQSLDVSESDEMEDQEQQRVLHCLKKFCEKHSASGPKDISAENKTPRDTDGEVMFVLSQLKFTSYLGEPCFAAAASTFPRPIDLKKQNQDRGDFDILVIHRHYGLLTAEIKSVGTYSTGKPESQAKEDNILLKRLQQATKQLNKSEDVLKYLTSDMHGQPRMTKTLMLPNISVTQLQRVLKDNPKIRQELCACFGIPETGDPRDFCLTSEQLSDRRHFWEVTDDAMNGLEQWWRTVMSSKGEDPVMTKELYEDLVARFAGPATTVEVFHSSAVRKASKVVRTEGEGVSETAARFMDFVLHQEQIEILNSGEYLVYLTGPPGTGKSVILLLQAEQWLKDGHDVHVVSMYNESIAASLYMIYSLKSKCPTLEHRIHFHTYHLGSHGNDEAVEDLAAFAKNGDLHVIVDEVDGSEFPEFFKKLCGRVKTLHLWAARIFHTYIPPSITEFVLSVPVRSPAAVSREIQKSDFVNKFGSVRGYDQNMYPHTDGPLIRELHHQGPGHRENVMPLDCEVCGTMLASVLKELHVGDSSNQTSNLNSPDPLHYRDVFMLCVNGFFENRIDEREGITNTNGMIKGLRQAGVPVTVLPASSTYTRSKEVTDMATMQGPDSVIATNCQCVSGLERKVVAWIQSAEYDSLSVHFDRLYAFSRTSGQLITVTTPCDSKLAEAKNQEAPLKAKKEMMCEPEGWTSDDQLEDMFIQLCRASITEDMIREVNAVFQFFIVHKNGEEHPIFLNIQEEGVGAGRGDLSQSRPAAIFRIHVEDLLLVLRGDIIGTLQAASTGRIKVHMNNFASLLRCDNFLKKLCCLYEERCQVQNLQ